MTEVERSLVIASKNGDIDSFNQLVRMYETRIYSLACRMLGDRDAAADVTQEAFISAFRALNRFRDGSFIAWLMRIATNACYDALRSRQRRPTTSIDQMTQPDDESAPREFAAAGPDLDEQMMTRELSEEIQAGLLTLPPDQRAVLIMCDIHGYSYEEVSVATESNLGTVKSRLSRARSKLRDYLKARELLPSQYRS